MFAFKGFCHLRGCCKGLAYIPDGLRWIIVFSLLRRLNTHYRNSRKILVGRQLSWVTSIVSRCSTDQWFMILIFLLQHPVMKLLKNSIFITELWWQHDTSLRRHPQWFVFRNKNETDLFSMLTQWAKTKKKKSRAFSAHVNLSLWHSYANIDMGQSKTLSEVEVAARAFV